MQRRDADAPWPIKRAKRQAVVETIPSVADNEFAFTIFFAESQCSTFITSFPDSTVKAIADKLQSSVSQKINSTFQFMLRQSFAFWYTAATEEEQSSTDSSSSAAVARMGKFSLTLPPSSTFFFPFAENGHLFGFKGYLNETPGGFTIVPYPGGVGNMAVFANKDLVSSCTFTGIRSINSRLKPQAIYDDLFNKLGIPFRPPAAKLEMTFSYTPPLRIASVTVNPERSLCKQHLGATAQFFQLVLDSLTGLNNLAGGNLLVAMEDDNSISLTKKNTSSKDLFDNASIVFRAGLNVAERLGIQRNSELVWKIGKPPGKSSFPVRPNEEEDYEPEPDEEYKQKMQSLMNDFATTLVTNRREFEGLVEDVRGENADRRDTLSLQIAEEQKQRQVAEQKRLDDEKKRLDEAAAAAIEKKRLDDIAQQKRLLDAAEQKRLDDIAKEQQKKLNDEAAAAIEKK